MKELGGGQIVTESESRTRSSKWFSTWLARSPVFLRKRYSNNRKRLLKQNASPTIITVRTENLNNWLNCLSDLVFCSSHHRRYQANRGFCLFSAIPQIVARFSLLLFVGASLLTKRPFLQEVISSLWFCEFVSFCRQIDYRRRRMLESLSKSNTKIFNQQILVDCNVWTSALRLFFAGKFSF